MRSEARVRAHALWSMSCGRPPTNTLREYLWAALGVVRAAVAAAVRALACVSIEPRHTHLCHRSRRARGGGGGSCEPQAYSGRVSLESTLGQASETRDDTTRAQCSGFGYALSVSAN